MYNAIAPEPIDGLQLRKMLIQLDMFLDNIDQISLEDSKYNSMRIEALAMKASAEEIILLSKTKDGVEGPAIEKTIAVTSLSDIILEEPSKPNPFLMELATQLELKDREQEEQKLHKVHKVRKEAVS